MRSTRVCVQRDQYRIARAEVEDEPMAENVATHAQK